MFKKMIFIVIFITGFCVAQNSNKYVWPEDRNIIIEDDSTGSIVFDTEGYTIFTLYFPASYDSALAYVYHSNDTTASTFRPVYDPDLNVIKSLVVTADREYLLSPQEYYYLKRYIRIFSSGAVDGADTIKAAIGKYYNR